MILLVLDMSRTDFQDTFQRRRDFIDPERLRSAHFGRPGKDDIIFLQALRMQPVSRVGHLQLICAVPLFCHDTGNCVAQLADAVGLKQGFILTVQAWDHPFHPPSLYFYSVHHRGMISRDVIAPSQAIMFRPGSSSGKSPLFTY